MLDWPEVEMATILPDREIVPLLGKVIVGGTPECIGSTSYEVRLGNRVRFDSTGEELDIGPGQFLEIDSGELVTVASLEKLDFTSATLNSLGKPGLVGFITPTTTMMREGFLFASTKVDPGFRGTLNWGIRNSSIKSVRLQHGERLFKLTLFELGPSEVPDKVYGERTADHYQDSDGIKSSSRLIPAQIPDAKIVRRSERKIDPRKQLQEAGPPFNYIGTELRELHGKWEVVSKDVALVKDGFKTLQQGIEEKIEHETSDIEGKISSLPDAIDKKIRGTFAEQFSLYFDQRMMRVYGTFGTLAALGGALYKLVIEATPSHLQGFALLGIALIIGVGTLMITRRDSK